MKWYDVRSSHIARIAYDEKEKYVYFEFLSGNCFKYPSTADEFDNLRRSNSIGSYRHKVYEPKGGTEVDMSDLLAD